MPSVLILAPLALAFATSANLQTDPTEVVRESEALLTRARTVQGSYTVVQGGATNRVDFVLEKPYQMALRSPGKVELFDGREHVVAHLRPGTYESRDAEVYGTPYLIGFTSFLQDPPGRTMTRPQFGPGRLVNIDGRVFVRRSSLDAANAMSYDIDPATKLPARWSWQVGGTTIVAAFQNLVLDQPVPQGTFDLPGAKTGRTQVPTREEGSLVALGSAVPNLTGTTLQRKRFDLREYTAGKRLTVLAFVDTNSMAGSNGLTLLGNLIRMNNLKDVGVVAVVRSNDATATRKVLRNFGPEPAAFAGAEATSAMQEFGVSLIPTFLVVDTAGNVVSRSIGFNKDALVAALVPPATH